VPAQTERAARALSLPHVGLASFLDFKHTSFLKKQRAISLCRIEIGLADPAETCLSPNGLCEMSCQERIRTELCSFHDDCRLTVQTTVRQLATVTEEEFGDIAHAMSCIGIREHGVDQADS